MQIREVRLKYTVDRYVRVQLDEQDDHEVTPAVRCKSIQVRDDCRLEFHSQRWLRQYLENALCNTTPLLIRWQLLVNVNEVLEDESRLVRNPATSAMAKFCHHLDQFLHHMIPIHIRT